MIEMRSSRTDRSMPLRADSAWRRNWITETPAISWGYWKARNMPALPRTSGSHSVTSSPRRWIDPPVTSYSGEPRSAEASVDLPEPLGPMRAWTSPSATVRSMPLRMSIPSVMTAKTFDLEEGGHGRSLRRPAGLVLRRYNSAGVTGEFDRLLALLQRQIKQQILTEVGGENLQAHGRSVTGKAGRQCDGRVAVDVRGGGGAVVARVDCGPRRCREGGPRHRMRWRERWQRARCRPGRTSPRHC